MCTFFMTGKKIFCAVYCFFNLKSLLKVSLNLSVSIFFFYYNVLSLYVSMLIVASSLLESLLYDLKLKKVPKFKVLKRVLLLPISIPLLQPSLNITWVLAYIQKQQKIYNSVSALCKHPGRKVVFLKVQGDHTTLPHCFWNKFKIGRGRDWFFIQLI